MSKTKFGSLKIERTDFSRVAPVEQVALLTNLPGNLDHARRATTVFLEALHGVFYRLYRARMRHPSRDQLTELLLTAVPEDRLYAVLAKRLPIVDWYMHYFQTNKGSHIRLVAYASLTLTAVLLINPVRLQYDEDYRTIVGNLYRNQFRHVSWESSMSVSRMATCVNQLLMDATADLPDFHQCRGELLADLVEDTVSPIRVALFDH